MFNALYQACGERKYCARITQNLVIVYTMCLAASLKFKLVQQTKYNENYNSQMKDNLSFKRPLILVPILILSWFDDMKRISTNSIPLHFKSSFIYTHIQTTDYI